MRIFTIICWSLGCALLLSMFSQIQDLFKYVFSLGALYAGVQFFKRYEERGSRVLFVVMTVLFYFILSVVFAVFIAIKTGLPEISTP